MLSFFYDCKAWPSSGTHSLSLSFTVFTVSLFFLIYSLSFSFSTSPPHFPLTSTLFTSFFVIYSLFVFINCISIAFILLVSSLPLCYTHLPSLTSMHSLFLNLSPFHNLLFFSFLTSPSLSLYSSSPLYCSSPYIYSSLPAPRVPQRETSRVVVPTEQLPCKAIQIEMFAENNMCVITA